MSSASKAQEEIMNGAQKALSMIFDSILQSKDSKSAELALSAHLEMLRKATRIKESLAESDIHNDTFSEPTAKTHLENSLVGLKSLGELTNWYAASRQEIETLPAPQRSEILDKIRKLKNQLSP